MAKDTRNYNSTGKKKKKTRRKKRQQRKIILVILAVILALVGLFSPMPGVNTENWEEFPLKIKMLR